LVVVGTGITVAGQATLESVDRMQRAEKLFYLVTDPATASWLHRLNPTATTLDDLYAPGKSRIRTYVEMSDRIVAAVRAGQNVCAAFYGHPGVFVAASHHAIRRLRHAGYPARMLPGVSAEDCLFADLGVNPGNVGCQSFEATDFLAARRRFDPTSELILWQVGVMGEASVRKGVSCRPARLQKLTDTLRHYYPARHPVVLYEASGFPGCEPMVKRTTLAKLPTEKVLSMTTLYVPPKPPRADDPRIMAWFDEP
jgi:uncharacterized protein YabN with tetrapyrrole methylase and pyrophosphatase domain